MDAWSGWTGAAHEGGVAQFGEDLRRERERLGVTVEAICAQTKLAEKHVRALESGDFPELPGGVFRRGFVRSYLRALGLEEVLWMQRFEQTCLEAGLADPAGTEWVAFAENVKNSRAAPPRRKGLRRVGGFAMMAAALLVAAWCCWRFALHRSLLPRPYVWPRLKSWVDNHSFR